MKRMLLCFFVLASFAFGQTTLTVQTNKQIVVPGETVHVTVNLSGQPIAALQFEMVLPGGVKLTSPLTNKTLYNLNNRYVLAELNRENIPTGVVAEADIVVNQILGLQVTNPLGAGGDGSRVPISVGTIVNIAFLGDLNGDGQLTQADFDISIDSVLDDTKCAGNDVNDDGVCNVQDAQIVSNGVTAQ